MGEVLRKFIEVGQAFEHFHKLETAALRLRKQAGRPMSVAQGVKINDLRIAVGRDLLEAYFALCEVYPEARHDRSLSPWV